MLNSTSHKRVSKVKVVFKNRTMIKFSCKIPNQAMREKIALFT
jgi:hypothetical protein